MDNSFFAFRAQHFLTRKQGQPAPAAPSSNTQQLTPQELAEFDKTGRLPEERPPHHIPCGNCGACATHEPCSRL